MSLTLRIQLSVMMFLQYAVWGVWLPILPRYLSGFLGFTGYQIGLIVGTAAAVGAITGPFISGQLADRHFNTEKFLGVSMILGGVLMWILSGTTTFKPFLILSIVYSIIYFPTISLTNSLTFHHLPIPDKQFSGIRVWGTLGWMAIGGIFSLVCLPKGLEGEALRLPLASCMKWSGVISMVYGVYCFFLPATPPSPNAEGAASLKAVKLLKNPAFLVVFITCFPIAVIHMWYFIWTSTYLASTGIADRNIMPMMMVGQLSELFVLGIVAGFLVKKWGLKVTMIVGILAYIIRFFLFSAFKSMPMQIFSITFHGFCFACFIVSVFIFVDKVCSPDIRASAQNFVNLLILGIGPLVAGPTAGMVQAWFTTGEGDAAVTAWGSVWLVPMAVGIVTLIFFAIFFRYDDAAEEQAAEAEA